MAWAGLPKSVSVQLLMAPPFIYLDNAATTYPKPEEVYRAADACFRRAGNPGRGGHKLALQSARTVFEAREDAARFLKAGSSDRLIFTPGCTYSINMVIKGLGTARHMGGRAYLDEGDVVLTSPLEHNAVMRTLKQIERQKGIRIRSLPYSPGKIFKPEDLTGHIEELKPKLVVTIEGSNVTGEVIETDKVAAICHEHSVPLLVDAAQTAGHFETDLSLPGITFWCASAHKSLMGAGGLGLLYVGENRHSDWGGALEPLVTGGTGSASESLLMPEILPDRLEAGSAPVVAIGVLKAALEWIDATGREKIEAHTRALKERFLSRMREERFLKIFAHHEGLQSDALSDRDCRAMRSLPNVSFTLDGMTPDRVADVLDRDFSIAVRPGLHCAALAHETLGTTESGLVRASFGYFNTEADVDRLCQALESMAGSKTRR